MNKKIKKARNFSKIKNNCSEVWENGISIGVGYIDKCIITDKPCNQELCPKVTGDSDE